MRYIRSLLLAIVVVGAAIPTLAAEPAEVAFYEVLPCAAPPVLDGKLDDACWQSLPVMDQFYKYWSPVPLPPPLKTAARLCYDDRALYMGVTMYEDNLDAIRANVTGRDEPQTWLDDCVEIMIDPHNTGADYNKFTTNFSAARHDQRSANLVLDDGWSVEGWQVATSRGQDAWFIEFAVPWSDLEVHPKAGDIWAFDLVRYGWSTGAFRGVSWSLGGAGAAPQKFGYLGFGSFTPLDKAKLRRIAAAVRKVKGDSFRIISDGQVFTHQPNAQWASQPLPEWLEASIARAEEQLTLAREAMAPLPPGPDRTRVEKTVADLDAALAALRQECPPARATASTAVMARYQAGQLHRRTAEAAWEGRVLALVAEAAGK